MWNTSNNRKKSYPHYTQVIHNFCGYVIEVLLQNPQNGEVKALSVSVPWLDVLVKWKTFLSWFYCFMWNRLSVYFKFHVSCETVWISELIRIMNYYFIEKLYVNYFMNYKSDLIIKYVSCETKMFCFTNVYFYNVYNYFVCFMWNIGFEMSDVKIEKKFFSYVDLKKG